MIGIFYSDGDGSPRMTGYARKGYRTTDENETLKETSEKALANVFQEAKDAGERLDGTDASIDAAVEDPLSFEDYLILVNGSIKFDNPEGTK
jgi:hypothetical protein